MKKQFQTKITAIPEGTCSQEWLIPFYLSAGVYPPQAGCLLSLIPYSLLPPEVRACQPQKPPKIRLSVVNTLCLLKKRAKTVHFCAEPVHFCSKPAQNQRTSAHFRFFTFSTLTSFHTSTYKNFPPEC
jgi:hypothetical protein